MAVYVFQAMQLNIRVITIARNHVRLCRPMSGKAFAFPLGSPRHRFASPDQSAAVCPDLSV
jgi:hypothetical protein